MGKLFSPLLPGYVKMPVFPTGPPQRSISVRTRSSGMLFCSNLRDFGIARLSLLGMGLNVNGILFLWQRIIFIHFDDHGFPVRFEAPVADPACVLFQNNHGFPCTRSARTCPPSSGSTTTDTAFIAPLPVARHRGEHLYFCKRIRPLSPFRQRLSTPKGAYPIPFSLLCRGISHHPVSGTINALSDGCTDQL